MAKPFTMEVDGLRDLISTLTKADSKFEKVIDAEIGASALKIEKEAKQTVVVNNGFLQNSINTRHIASMMWEVYAQAPYAAYVEFGTGGLVNVPAGLESYAIQFKGKGLRVVNLPARPFLFPAYFRNRQLLLNRLNQLKID